MVGCFFVAVFQGMHQTECSEDYELAFLRAAEAVLRHADRDVEVRTACFAPPYHAEENAAWVSYEPLPGETYTSTTNVPRLQEQLKASMTESWSWFQGLPDASLGIVVGVSNGGKPAAAVASSFPQVRQLVLLSSVPAPEQQQELAWHFDGEVLMTVAKNETVFGGPATFYRCAGRLLAHVVSFSGRHCEECPALLREIGRSVARKLHASIGGRAGPTRKAKPATRRRRLPR